MALSAQTTNSLSSFVSPNTLYYLALYFLVLVVRFFKLKKQPPETWDWKDVFHVALEIVYTSSGLVILLLQGLKDYVAVIIVVYLIMIYVSSQIDSMEEKFAKTATFATHLGIVLIVVLTTVGYFEIVQRNIDREAQNRTHSYRVVIPYDDQTLRTHIGQRLFGARQLVSTVLVSAGNESQAKQDALDRFWKTVVPFKDVQDPKAVIFVPAESVTAELEVRQ